MGVPYLDRPAALYVWADLRKVKSCKDITAGVSDIFLYYYLNLPFG